MPGGYDGNYIMYPFSVSGYDPNNSHFSPCSIGFISRVLDVIANGRRRRCFKGERRSRAASAGVCRDIVGPRCRMWENKDPNDVVKEAYECQWMNSRSESH